MALTKIKTSGIADNAITNAKMADDAIDSADLADGSIDNAHLAGSIAVSKTLLAGGTGRRLLLAKNTLPKQFIKIGNYNLIEYFLRNSK